MDFGVKYCTCWLGFLSSRQPTETHHGMMLRTSGCIGNASRYPSSPSGLGVWFWLILAMSSHRLLVRNEADIGRCSHRAVSTIRLREGAFQGCVDFDAKRQFLVGHVERVIYNRYKITLTGSVPGPVVLGGHQAAISDQGEIDQKAVRSRPRRDVLKMGRVEEWRGRKRSTAVRRRTSGRPPYRADPERVGEARRSDGRFGCGRLL